MKEPLIRLPSPTAINAEKLRRRLFPFIVAAWSIVEPGAKFVSNWHIGLMCEYLEALTLRQLRRVIFNIPPRCMKSLTVCVFWPAWMWTRDPTVKILSASHSAAFGTRDCVKTRRLITSPWYRERWGHLFNLTGDQNQKTWYENDLSGYRLGLSVNTGVTGHGGNVRILDDPIDVKKADSKQIRTETNTWISKAWLNRSIEPKTDLDVLVMQRCHANDPTGHLKDRGGWKLVKIPMEHNPKVQVNGFKIQDPRTEKGDLLFPERFGQKEVDIIKVDAGSYDYAGQYQQEPAPAKGGIFKRAWITRYKWVDGEGLNAWMELEGGERVRPRDCFRFITVDMARTLEEINDYTVMAVWAVFYSKPYRVYLLDVIRERMEEPDIIPTMKSFNAKWKAAYFVPEQTGMEGTVTRMKREGLRVRPVKTERDKVTRARVAAPLMESGRIIFPEEAPWLSDCETEVLRFPKGEHDDFVDNLSLCVEHTEEEFRGKGGKGFQRAQETEYQKELRDIQREKRKQALAMRRRIPRDDSPLDRFRRGE